MGDEVKITELESAQFIDANFDEIEKFVEGCVEFRNGKLLVPTVL